MQHRVLHNYIIPGYQALEISTSTLNQQLVTLCTNTGKDSFIAVKQAYYQLVGEWVKIEWFRIGPIIQKSRVERFFFFPDRKSIGLRQVQSNLAKENNTVLDIMQLQDMSVALQGLHAIEYLVFGKGSESLEMGNAFRCTFAQNSCTSGY